MILVDTSVWIDHLRLGEEELERLLGEGRVLSHPFVIGELACGNLRNRAEILGLLSALPTASTASHAEVLRLVDDRVLAGKGLGWIDVHLLASALVTKCPLWTKDKALRAAAGALDAGT
ncbi:MAG: VapC toxin family PIN domain ribonuclease [Gemmatimonadetes bacterium]|nr:VapC toxin family PIN domain ribonuclease [Gemmatimonadota bacterium]